jgi:hypothetical protein
MNRLTTLPGEKEVVEVVERDVLLREFADQYYIIRQHLLPLSAKMVSQIRAEGIDIDEPAAQAMVDETEERIRKILAEFAAGLRLASSAKKVIEPKDGVEYRINNDMSSFRRACFEALRPTTEDDEIIENDA